MNTRRITVVSQAILAAQKSGVALAAPLAMALEAKQLLRLPEDAAELLVLRARVAELEPEKDTTAPAEAMSTPGTVLVALARALREQPTAARLLDGLDELGEVVVCDGSPGEIASWVAALCHLVHLDVPPTGPTVVYRAAHDAIGVGLYDTAEEARRHCEVLVSREHPADVTVAFDWLADEEDGDLAAADLIVQVAGGDEVETGYTVTPLEVATAYDPDADE
ncbi:hypothetical protein ACFW9O_25160 [Streptomyces sp. NPDC059499]|uniref:hypothetical protein n=1 Tax=Streptomyces sp. NPDC059499 TaxID=3346852 RepID=UPI00367EDEA2